ncbi:MAG: OmpA family protein [Saprospiraceae bacterium]
MRVLLFILWLTLGLIYGLIWIQSKSCCDNHLKSANMDEGVGLAQRIKPVPPVVTAQTNSPDSDNLILSPDLSFEADSGCVLFKWGKSDPIIKPCFEAFRDSITKSLKQGKSLEIISDFYEQENTVMASGDLGLIRAVKIKDLFTKNINPDLIRIRSLPRSDSTGKQNRLLYTLHFRQVFMNGQVKELDTKTLIYFRYASNQQDNDILVNQYIDDLASRLKNTGDIINLTGHTDDDASAEHNAVLGLKRAQIIKDLLVTRGIKSSRIKIKSKGESEPIAPNNTEENRKQNRRVELTIVQPQNKN